MKFEVMHWLQWMSNTGTESGPSGIQAKKAAAVHALADAVREAHGSMKLIEEMVAGPKVSFSTPLKKISDKCAAARTAFATVKAMDGKFTAVQEEDLASMDTLLTNIESLCAGHSAAKPQSAPECGTQADWYDVE